MLDEHIGGLPVVGAAEELVGIILRGDRVQ
jgi:CBS domain-containing protein